jgi:hypothetical protein
MSMVRLSGTRSSSQETRACGTHRGGPPVGLRRTPIGGRRRSCALLLLGLLLLLLLLRLLLLLLLLRAGRGRLVGGLLRLLLLLLLLLLRLLDLLLRGQLLLLRPWQLVHAHCVVVLAVVAAKRNQHVVLWRVAGGRRAAEGTPQAGTPHASAVCVLARATPGGVPVPAPVSHVSHPTRAPTARGCLAAGSSPPTPTQRGQQPLTAG